MINIDSMIKKTQQEGFKEEDATAKVCQDIILNVISRSSLNENITIKGGIVMRSISQNARRATQDIDIDFIRYSLADVSIRHFVEKLNNIDGLKIELYGKLEELKQQDYHGKRAYIKITDSFGFEVTSKVDLGVHKHLDVHQVAQLLAGKDQDAFHDHDPGRINPDTLGKTGMFCKGVDGVEDAFPALEGTDILDQQVGIECIRMVEIELLPFLKRHILESDHPLDGIFCGNDAQAWQVVHILRAMGRRVPEDVQVIGFDGTRMFGNLDYVCSTIVQPVPDLAETAVNMVLSNDFTGLPPLVCLPVRYQPGGTTRDGEGRPGSR